MSPFLQGTIIGLTFAVLLGPGFFALIQTSILRGFKSGALMAFGIFVSDLAALFLCYFGFSQILGEDPRQHFLFGIIGGIVLIIFGTFTFARTASNTSKTGNNGQSSPSNGYIYVIKGFLLNFANPGMWFIWITVMVSVGANFGINTRSIFAFFIGILGTILFTDLLKCFIAHRIKQFLNAAIMTLLNRIVGIILVVFGSYLILNVIFDLKSMILF